MGKRIIAGVLLLFFLLISLPIANAREYIAEEDAEANRIGYGNIPAEIMLENAFMPVSLLNVSEVEDGAALAVSIAGGGAGNAALYGMDPTLATMIIMYDKTAARWMNWPSGRYIYSTAEPENSSGVINRLFSSIPVSIVSLIANKVFEFTKILVALGINIIVLAFNTNWAGTIATFIGDVTNQLIDFENYGAFKMFFLFGICALTLSITYNFLKAQMTQAFTAFLISVLVLAGIIGWEANCKDIILAATSLTDELGGASMTMLTKAMPMNDTTSTTSDNLLNKGLRAAGNTVWQTIVVNPWAVTLFGTTNPNKLKLTAEEIESINRELETPLAGGRDYYLDTVYLGAAADDHARTVVCNTIAKANRFVNHGDHSNASMFMSCSSSNATRYLTSSMITTFPALAFFVLAAFIGGSMIICQFMLVVMLVFSPIVLLVALYPNAGWHFAMNFFKKMVGLLGIKVVYGLYLGVVLFMGTAVTANTTVLGNRLGAVMFFLTIIFAGAVIWRKKVFDMAVNLTTKVQDAAGNGSLLREMRRSRRILALTDTATDYFFSRGSEPRPPMDTRKDDPMSDPMSKDYSQYQGGQWQKVSSEEEPPPPNGNGENLGGSEPASQASETVDRTPPPERAPKDMMLDDLYVGEPANRDID